MAQDGSGPRKASPSALAATLDAAAGGGSSQPNQDGPEDGREDSLVTQVIGERYRLLRLAGTGGMGRIYEAEHIGIGRRVAVKVLHPEFAVERALVARFEREARAATKIGNPHIVEITDSSRTPAGHVYFVMEFLEGTDLADLLDRAQRLPVERAVRIVLQICDALQAAHEAGIIHRDLKPENVFLVTRDGTPDFVKIVDFGVALDLEREKLTRDARAFGTPEYMAPEQVAGKPTARSDVYATAVLLYELLTGDVPWSGSTVMEIFHRKANDPPRPIREIRPEVPAALERVILRGLARLEKDRPACMAEFGAEIERAMREPDPPPVDRPTTPRPGQRTRRRSQPILTPPWLGAIVLAAILVAIFLGVGGVRRSDSTPVTEPEPTAEDVPIDTPIVVEAIVTPPPTPKTAPDAGPPKLAARRNRPRTADPRHLADGEAALRNGSFAEARAAFNAALANGANRGAALAGLAAVAFQEQNFPEAARLARQAIAAGDRRAELIAGKAYLKLGEFAKAKAAFENVLRRSPANAEAERNLAVTLRQLGEAPP